LVGVLLKLVNFGTITAVESVADTTFIRTSPGYSRKNEEALSSKESLAARVEKRVLQSLLQVKIEPICPPAILPAR
jgi:hypothetical protein